MSRIVFIMMICFLFVYQIEAEEKTSTPTKLDQKYQGGGISFYYPREWVSWEKNSFDRMRDFAKSQQGMDLLVMLKENNETVVLQVGKQQNLLSFEKFFNEKKNFADYVTAKGAEYMGFRYTNYFVEAINLSNIGRTMLGYTERSDGSGAVTYQFLDSGFEYDFNFIYKISSSSENAKNKQIREMIISTVKLLR